MLMVSGPVYNLTTILENIGKGWRKETSHPTIHSVPKKILLNNISFLGLGFRVQRTSWDLLNRTDIPQCFALLVEEASWFFFAMENFHKKKPSHPSNPPLPSFQKPHQGWFLLGYLWTSESLFLPLDTVQMSYSSCLGTKAVPRNTGYSWRQNKISPNVCLTLPTNAKRKWYPLPQCFDRKKFRKRLKSFDGRLRDVEGKLQALNFHPPKRQVSEDSWRWFNFLKDFCIFLWRESWSWPPFLLYALDFNGAWFCECRYFWTGRYQEE